MMSRRARGAGRACRLARLPSLLFVTLTVAVVLLAAVPYVLSEDYPKGDFTLSGGNVSDKYLSSSRMTGINAPIMAELLEGTEVEVRAGKVYFDHAYWPENYQDPYGSITWSGKVLISGSGSYDWKTGKLEGTFTFQQDLRGMREGVSYESNAGADGTFSGGATTEAYGMFDYWFDLTFTGNYSATEYAIADGRSFKEDYTGRDVEMMKVGYDLAADAPAPGSTGGGKIPGPASWWEWLTGTAIAGAVAAALSLINMIIGSSALAPPPVLSPPELTPYSSNLTGLPEPPAPGIAAGTAQTDPDQVTILEDNIITQTVAWTAKDVLEIPDLIWGKLKSAGNWGVGRLDDYFDPENAGCYYEEGHEVYKQGEYSGWAPLEIRGKVDVIPYDDPGEADRLDYTTGLKYGDTIVTGRDSEVVLDEYGCKITIRQNAKVFIPKRKPDSRVWIVASNIWRNVKKIAKDGSMETTMNEAIAGTREEGGYIHFREEYIGHENRMIIEGMLRREAERRAADASRPALERLKENLNKGLDRCWKDLESDADRLRKYLSGGG